jgi:hypothetical protein
VKSRALFEGCDQFLFLAGLGMSFDLPDEPKETFGCGVLASLELVADKVLQGIGLKGSSKLAVSDFLVITTLVSSMRLPAPSNMVLHRLEAYLDVALHITLDRLEGSTA